MDIAVALVPEATRLTRPMAPHVGPVDRFVVSLLAVVPIDTEESAVVVVVDPHVPMGGGGCPGRGLLRVEPGSRRFLSRDRGTGLSINPVVVAPSGSSDPRSSAPDLPQLLVAC